MKSSNYSFNFSSSPFSVVGFPLIRQQIACIPYYSSLCFKISYFTKPFCSSEEKESHLVITYKVLSPLGSNFYAKFNASTVFTS